MNTNIEVLRELDELVEAARLLGVTQAKKGFDCHTDEDRRFERAMYESIDKHRAALVRMAEGRYHPCTHILIDGLKRLEGGAAVLAEWDRARAQADAALAAQTQPKRRRYDPNGSLSEYGIFPECDAQPLDTGITAAELGYALKRATPTQVIEYLEDDVNMRVALSIHFEEQHDQQPAAVDEAMVELARKARRLQRDHFGDGMSLHLTMMDWAREYDALATQQQKEPTT